MVLKINMDKGEIEVDETCGTSGDSGEAGWKSMVQALPPNEPRYVCYDFDYTTEDGRAQRKLVFIAWCVHRPLARGRAQRASRRGLARAHVCACGCSLCIELHWCPTLCSNI